MTLSSVESAFSFIKNDGRQLPYEVSSMGAFFIWQKMKAPSEEGALDRACKPSSVESSHLSGSLVAEGLKPLFQGCKRAGHPRLYRCCIG